MGYSAAVLSQIEDALAGCYRYHNALDSFLLRSGVSEQMLATARAKANERSQNSAFKYPKASKRYVVQEVMKEIAKDAANSNHIFASIVSSFVSGKFPDAEQQSLDAIEFIKSEIKNNRDEKNLKQQEQQRERAEKEKTEEAKRQKIYFARLAKKEDLKQKFEILIQERDAQKRGFKLETFLNEFFEMEGLKPRQSFRIVGEQIDGSFVWGHKTHLVEAKWQQEMVAGKEFGAFTYKLDGKTVDTRGLFISINGYSREAIQGLNGKGALKFVCIDGAHVMRCLTTDLTLIEILEKIWRHADETGEAYLPISSF